MVPTSQGCLVDPCCISKPQARNLIGLRTINATSKQPASASSWQQLAAASSQQDNNNQPANYLAAASSQQHQTTSTKLTTSNCQPAIRAFAYRRGAVSMPNETGPRLAAAPPTGQRCPKSICLAAAPDSSLRPNTQTACHTAAYLGGRVKT